MYFFQVTGYGWKGRGDANDVWRVVAVGEKKGTRIRALRDHNTNHTYYKYVLYILTNKQNI